MAPKFKEISVDGYESVVEISDADSGLHAIISVHNTALGPALGGTRIYPYKNINDALSDCLRLSKGMTYKSALAECGLGGGKSVIIADPKRHKTEKLLHAFGLAVDKLAGLYICAEDVGCTTRDVGLIREKTQFVTGLDHENSSGDPSRFTAWGGYRGIQAVMMQLYGSPSVEGRTVAVQGLGAVGSKICEQLFWHGAKLKVSDVDPVKVRHFAKRYGAEVVPVDEILYTECDVLSPNALGGLFSRETIPHLQCKGIAGCANNQLLKQEDAIRLMHGNIVYAPDFVISAGGLINVQFELSPEGYQPRLAQKKVSSIYDTLLDIFTIAEQNVTSTHQAAIALAEYRLKYGIGKRSEELCFHHH